MLKRGEDDGLSFEVVVLGSSRILLSYSFDHNGSELGEFDELGRVGIGSFCCFLIRRDEGRGGRKGVSFRGPRNLVRYVEELPEGK